MYFVISGSETPGRRETATITPCVQSRGPRSLECWTRDQDHNQYTNMSPG